MAKANRRIVALNSSMRLPLNEATFRCEMYVELNLL